MPSLSLDESRRRAALLHVDSYDVTLDLTGDEETFTSSTVIRFRATGHDATFVDVKPRSLVSASLNGTPIDPSSLAEGRLVLPYLETDNELVVEAVMAYRNDGEGLHRAVDPADGLAYTYAMSFLDAAPSIFACFDQPDLKAPYTLHVRAPESWVVIGNGHADHVGGGEWELATTQPLSTYFVTLVAGPYHLIRDEHDGIPLGLSARASLAAHLDREAEELLTVTKQSFDEFHRLFGIRYPFGDYHQAFVPEFNAGAMENPGCVTFRDPLVFSSKVTRAQRATRAATVAHEMAHQWFGNLVTPQWWDDLWLNESFAEYMGNRVTAEVTEFSDIALDMALVRKPWGVAADQRPSTHPVAGNGAVDAVAALQDFDGISYGKGSAVLRQLHAKIGEDVFLAGARDHFTRHRFGNATMHDLFQSWERSGAGDLDGWTTGWLRTAGLDLLSIDRSGAEPAILRATPEEHPADREHQFTVAHHDEGTGWQRSAILVRDDRTPLPCPPGSPILLDVAVETWARLGLDEQTAEALPRLLPEMTDPLMRAGVWNAVRDATYNALLDPRQALRLVVAGLPLETHDLAISAIGTLGIDLADRFLTDHETALAQVHAAAERCLARTAAGSAAQLAAVRTEIATCADAGVLRDRLDAGSLPEGADLDLDLRWRVLTRLAALGGIQRSELTAWREKESTTEAGVHYVAAVASMPDAEAKAFAWEHFDGTAKASNYELEAAGIAMWQPGQESLTAPYVDRYFAEVAGTTAIRSGWMLADGARAFFPALAVHRTTLDACDRVLAVEALDLSLRRALVDAADDLRRAVEAQRRFGD